MTSRIHRIVHLDLKGAPWKVPYLEKVITASKNWGATGILFEWEDTFPYTGIIKDIGSIGNSSKDDLYSPEEVKHLLKFVKEHGLEAIQLVQTIGHMEFVLKHPAFRGMRETQRSAAVLCPSHPDALALVKTMLQQVLDAQPDAKYLHIGADEVWHCAVCPACQSRVAENRRRNKECLYLEHIRELASFVKRRAPHLTVLMWDDMLRSVSRDVLNEYELGKLVEPVVWNYNTKECFNIDPNLWETYRGVFPRVWGGSAYKGANGSCCIVAPAARYVSNHEAWRAEVARVSGVTGVGGQVTFAGVILTGWSRYDHYSTLCELLPVALPSLAGCLHVLLERDGAGASAGVGVEGGGAARAVCELAAARGRARDFLHGDVLTTWLNPWQLQHCYLHPAQLEGILHTADTLCKELSLLSYSLMSLLLEVTGPRSTDEFIGTFVMPELRRLQDLKATVEGRIDQDAGVTPTNVL